MPYQREVQIYSATLRFFFFLGVSASLLFLWIMLWMSRIGALTSEDPLGRKGADESWCGLTWLISLFGPLFCCLHIVLWDTLTSFQAFSFLLSLHHCLPSLLLILTSSGHRRPRVCARLCLFDSDEASFSVWWSWMYAAVSRPTSRAETEGHQAWTTQKKEMLAANILHRVDDISPLLRTLYLWQEGILIECWNPIFSLLRFALFLRTRTSFFIGVCPPFDLFRIQFFLGISTANQRPGSDNSKSCTRDKFHHFARTAVCNFELAAVQCIGRELCIRLRVGKQRTVVRGMIRWCSSIKFPFLGSRAGRS